MRKSEGGSAVKWIIGAAFAGWAGILRLIWLLAAGQQDECRFGRDCIERVIAHRDSALVTAASLGLVGFTLLALACARSLPSPSLWNPSKWGVNKPIRLPDQRDD